MDIADRSTCPPELAERVRELAEKLVSSTDRTSDLALDQHDEEFRTLLEGHLVRAYHCTRLLDQRGRHVSRRRR